MCGVGGFDAAEAEGPCVCTDTGRCGERVGYVGLKAQSFLDGTGLRVDQDSSSNAGSTAGPPPFSKEGPYRLLQFLSLLLATRDGQSG